jgi:hypothetical protein
VRKTFPAHERKPIMSDSPNTAENAAQRNDFSGYDAFR